VSTRGIPGAVVSFVGTKGGKPITAIEKRQRRLMQRTEGRERREERREKRTSITVLEAEILKNVDRDLKNLDLVTPYEIVQKYNVKYSTAKRVLLELARRGIVNINLKARRIIVATPVKQ